MQYDNVVVNNLAASASQTRFRQKLFGHSFGSDTGSQSHTVKLTAVLSGEGLAGEWLDLDYITFTSSSNARFVLPTLRSLMRRFRPRASVSGRGFDHPDS